MKMVTGIDTDSLVPWAMPSRAVPGRLGRLPAFALRGLVLVPAIACLAFAWVLAMLLAASWMILSSFTRHPPAEWD